MAIWICENSVLLYYTVLHWLVLYCNVHRLCSSLLDSPDDRKLFMTKRKGVQATIISGNAISKYIRSRLSQEVQQLTDTYGRPPSLAVILVGDDPASHTYVGAKAKAARTVGIVDRTVKLPGTVSKVPTESCD